MVALADINATLQEQNQTLDSVNKNLVAMLRADLDAAKRDARESGRRREREREASQKNRVATSQLGAGAAFKRGLIGDGLGGAIDKLMAGALGGLAGLIPLAMAGVGRGIRFGAAALVANAFIEDALNYAFDNFPGFEGLDNLQRKEFLDKATTGMNAAFIARFMGAKMPATIAAALGAAYAKEIGQFIGGTVDENGNLTITNPVDGLLTSLGYEDILPKEFKLGPMELQAVGAVGAVIMTSVISNIFKLMRFIPAGRMLTLLGTLGLAGFDDLVKLIKDSKAASLPPRVVTDPRTNLPRQSNAAKPYQPITKPSLPLAGEKIPAPLTTSPTQPTLSTKPYHSIPGQQRGFLGQSYGAPQSTTRINPIFESRRPLTGQTLRSAATTSLSSQAPYNPTSQFPLPPQLEARLKTVPHIDRLKQLARGLIKILGPAIAAYLIFEICRIQLGMGPYEGMSKVEKRAQIAALLGGFLQGTALVMLGGFIGGAAATGTLIGAGWGTLIGAAAGGVTAYFAPNIIGDMLAAWVLGFDAAEYEKKIKKIEEEYGTNMAFHTDMLGLTAMEGAGVPQLFGSDAFIQGYSPIPPTQRPGYYDPSPFAGMFGNGPFGNMSVASMPKPYFTQDLATRKYHKTLKEIAQRKAKDYLIDMPFSGTPVGNTYVFNTDNSDNSDRKVIASGGTDYKGSISRSAIDPMIQKGLMGGGGIAAIPDMIPLFN